MNGRRSRKSIVCGLILTACGPWCVLAGEFDLDERRILAGVRDYPPKVIDALILLAERGELLQRASADPAGVAGDARLDDGARIALLELFAYPGLLSIAADSPSRAGRLAALLVRSPDRFEERVARLRTQYAHHARDAAAQWQRLLDRDAAALGEYRELLTAFCESQKSRFGDFPYVAARSRAYYLVCPPDEAVLAFAAQYGVSETLGRVLQRWAEDYSPAALDERILENGEEARTPRADEVLAYLPAARRAEMWSMEIVPDDRTIGLIPVMLQPPGDQPLEARNARVAAETARLWGMSAAPAAQPGEMPVAGAVRPYPHPETELPASRRYERASSSSDGAADTGWMETESRAADISSLRSEPWTPYTELVPTEEDNGYYGGYSERYDSGAPGWGYGDSSYGYRGYTTYHDRWYPGSWLDYGTSVAVYPSDRFYDSYSCGVPVYYGSRAVAACPPTVIWQSSTPLFVRDRSTRSGLSISIGLRDDCDSRRTHHFGHRTWSGEPVRWGRGRDVSERAHIESSTDSLRRRPSSVTTVPQRPGEPTAEQRIRSARQNLTDRLDELRDRAGRNAQSLGRRSGPSAPAGLPATAPPGASATVRRGPAAPAGRPAVEPGASRTLVPRRPAISPGPQPRRGVQPSGAVQSAAPSSRKSAPQAQPPGGSTRAIRPTAIPPRSNSVTGATSNTPARGPIQRVKRSSQPGQPNKP